MQRLPSRLAVALRLFGIGDQGVDRLSEPGLITVRVVGVVVHQRTGDSVGDHLGYATDVGGHHRGAAGHRFEVDDAQRLIDRRAYENCCSRKYLAYLSDGQHFPDPEHAGARAGQLGYPGGHFGGDFRRVGRSGAQHQLDVGTELVRGRQQVGDAFLPGDPPDECHHRPAAVDAEVGEHRLPREQTPTARPGATPRCRSRCARHAPGRDPASDRPATRRRACPELTAMTASAAVTARLFHPRRDPVAAAELLGLPRPQRLQRVRGQHVRDVVEHCGQLPGQAGVPGVGVDHAGLRGGIGHHQIRRQRRQRRVRAAQLRVGLIRERARSGRAHAVHVDLAQLAQLRDELGYVHPRAAVDLRRILPSHHRHPHTRHGSSRLGMVHVAGLIQIA